jgi:hypothetical protein
MPRQTGDCSVSAAKATKTPIKSGNGEDPSYTQGDAVPLAARSRE